jgi:ParB-like chromosome segregation protein Spo0J
MHRKLEINYRSIKELKPSRGNARNYSDAQIRQVARSIEAFGFINPIIVDKQGSLVARHPRLLAAERLGLEIVPTIHIDRPDETENRTLRCEK